MPRSDCPRCTCHPIASSYPYLLGPYLGDGHITIGRRRVQALSIFCGDAWPGIIDEHPGPFLRGLFHSDGCRITNWTRRRVAGVSKRYEYPRWFFANESADILGLCAASPDRMGIAHRRPRYNAISVARRAAVAIMDEVVGPKR